MALRTQALQQPARNTIHSWRDLSPIMNHWASPFLSPFHGKRAEVRPKVHRRLGHQALRKRRRSDCRDQMVTNAQPLRRGRLAAATMMGADVAPESCEYYTAAMT